MSNLFAPLTAGKLQLANRLVMAPLTRNRAGDAQVPGEFAAAYYGQRAGAGLIITEGTQPSAVGQGYLNTPGLHSPAQIAGWRAVSDTVHAAGGQIVVQLMHAGRIGHPDNKNGLESVAPSAIAAPGTIVTPSGPQDYPTPRALDTEDLPGVVAEFVQSAQAAIEAGLDGVELHAANGYLLHQFLAPSSNQRTDAFGGSPEARARFVIEVARAVSDVIGGERVGIRISPAHNIQGVLEEDAEQTRATYRALIDGLAPFDLAYLHILGDPRGDLTRDLFSRFNGARIINSGFGEITDREEAETLLNEDLGDAVSIGRNFLANPDLVRRWQADAPLNEPDESTYYGGGARGYIDYPFLSEQTS